MSTTAERVDHAPATSSLPSAASIGLARIRLELRLFFRERDAVVFMFAYPVVMLAIFATVFGQQDAAPGFSYARWFLPGMIATGVMLLSFQNLAIMISLERDDDGLKRLRATPMPASSYFIGKVGLVLVTSVVQTTLLLVVAATVFDVPMPASVSAWTTFAWAFALASATGCVCGIGFSSLPSSGRAASAVVSPVVIILQFISGVFSQYESLPTWMKQIASIFPLKWMAQGMRSVFLPASAETIEVGGSWQHGATAAVLIVWLVLGVVIGIRAFRWTRRDDR